jgi:carbon-monoxide dehydrogenase medium subunit
VKPPPFEYAAPDSLDEVLHLLSEHGDEAKIIAGGQSLVPLLSMRLARPSVLVDINRVPSLDGIASDNGSVVFGATVRERDAERSSLVAERVPLMAEALPLIGHVSIRNRGTIGGSLAHADPSAELPAVAVLTEASIVARSSRGERSLPASEFFQGFFTTALADDECVVEVKVPASSPGTGWGFVEVARRHGDFAMVGAAAMVGPDEARVCLIGVADRPVRIDLGSPPAAPYEEVAADAIRELDPPSDMHGSSSYRRHLAGVTIRRALALAASRVSA